MSIRMGNSCFAFSPNSAPNGESERNFTNLITDDIFLAPAAAAVAVALQPRPALAPAPQANANGVRKKRRLQRFTPEQIQMLEQEYRMKKYLPTNQKIEVARRIGLTESQVCFAQTLKSILTVKVCKKQPQQPAYWDLMHWATSACGCKLLRKILLLSVKLDLSFNKTAQKICNPYSAYKRVPKFEG